MVPSQECLVQLEAWRWKLGDVRLKTQALANEQVALGEGLRGQDLNLLPSGYEPE